MNWLRRKIGEWGTGSMAIELSEFATRLDQKRDAEIGTLLALATDFRHVLLRALDRDVVAAGDLVAEQPMIGVMLAEQIKKLQKIGDLDTAAGAVVWLHTLRGAANPPLLPAAQAMWLSLSRGMPWVSQAVDEYHDLTGRRLIVAGHDQMPRFS